MATIVDSNSVRALIMYKKSVQHKVCHLKCKLIFTLVV